MADDVKVLTGEDRLDALCAVLSFKHGIHLPLEVYNPEAFTMKSSGVDGDAGDWTAAGQDKDGFPVPKGSEEDVTAKPEPEITQDIADDKAAA